MANTRVLVVTHGDLGEQLVAVVEMILGPVEGLSFLSNRSHSALTLTKDISSWLDSPDAGADDRALIFIDDYAGSCANAAQLACEGHAAAVISGVNLAMVLSVTTWRDTLEFEELIQQLIRKGREAITRVSGPASS